MGNRKYYIFIIIILSFFLFFTNKERLEGLKKIEKNLIDISEKDTEIKSLQNKIEKNNANLYNINYVSKIYNNLKLGYLERQKFSGTFKDYYLNGKIKVIGEFKEGKQRGKWTYYNIDGTNSKYEWIKYRVGAICCDGSRSYSTGRGTCSHHNGVCTWLYDYKKEKR